MLVSPNAPDRPEFLVNSPVDPPEGPQAAAARSRQTGSGHVYAAGPVPAALKTLYLEKVIGSRSLARSAQLRRLLQFLGARTLAEGESPTESEVALQVLRRGVEFDPRIDSLVRKEMSRLRIKLAEYYQREGTADPVLIQSGGSYRLDFRWRAGVSSERSGRCLLILPATASETDRELADVFYDELMLQLSGVRGCRLVCRTSAHFYAGQSRDIREISRQSGADSIVEIAVRRFRDEPAVTLWLVDGATGLMRATLRIDHIGTRAELTQQTIEWLSRNGEILER